MAKHQQLTNLEQLFDCIGKAAEQKRNEKVSIDSIMEMIGRRSFGPLLLLAGLIILAPVIGDIPGVPTIMGVFILLVAVQLLIGQEHFWLPKWLCHCHCLYFHCTDVTVYGSGTFQCQCRRSCNSRIWSCIDCSRWAFGIIFFYSDGPDGLAYYCQSALIQQ